MDFISALKATNYSDEPKKTHAQIMREQLGAAPSENNTHTNNEPKLTSTFSE